MLTITVVGYENSGDNALAIVYTVLQHSIVLIKVVIILWM